MYRRIDVLVEGRDDREFFDAVIRPILEEQYQHMEVTECAGYTIEKRTNYIRSIRAMAAEYLFVTDINASPCVTEKKERKIDQHRGIIDADRLIVVRSEIASWYLVGLNDVACAGLGIASLPQTDDVTKEQFRDMVPGQFSGSVVDFMKEILKAFRLDVAREKNRSFCYLMDLLENKSGEA